tara:strand:+ start:1245 stop:1442 length:198 start_codon:yes stop_codon:yes gene_type:complete
MYSEKKLKLEKDLPNCPKGRIFKESVDGNFFHSMTIEEYLGGELKNYKFTKDEVEQNKDWFSNVC